MIYEYEANILKYVNEIFPKIELATYSKESEMFNAMSSVTRFPAFYYSRGDQVWEFNKIFKISDETGVYSFIPYEQSYSGKILVENQKDAIIYASKLRFAWNKNPYLEVTYLNNKLKVGLRLLGISIGEERYADNRKGAMRYVQLNWKSQLFFSDTDIEDFKNHLVKEVRIYLDKPTNLIKVLGENEIIKEVKY